MVTRHTTNQSDRRNTVTKCSEYNSMFHKSKIFQLIRLFEFCLHLNVMKLNGFQKKHYRNERKTTLNKIESIDCVAFLHSFHLNDSEYRNKSNYFQSLENLSLFFPITFKLSFVLFHLTDKYKRGKSNVIVDHRISSVSRQF